VITILKYISLFSPLLALTLGWRNRYTLLWLYAAAGLFLDTLGLVLRLNALNHHIPLNGFLLVQLICISLYYKDKIFSSHRIFLFISISLIIGFILHTVITSFFKLNFLGAGLLCIVYIGYGILGYLTILKNKNELFLNRLPFFWINTAFFLSASSNCLLFLFATYLTTESYKLMLSIWFSFFISINILHYLFIGIGLYKSRSRET
jgi:hypothetical protein